MTRDIEQLHSNLPGEVQVWCRHGLKGREREGRGQGGEGEGRGGEGRGRGEEGGRSSTSALDCSPAHHSAVAPWDTLGG